MELMDDEVVMPLWLWRLSLSPFPFQILVMCPVFHVDGIISSSQIVLIRGKRKSDMGSPGLFNISFLMSVVDLPFDLLCMASMISDF